jgi:hypothetical protein
LIPKSNWASGFGRFIGEDAALWESVLLVGLAEQYSPQGQPLKSLAELPELIRDARRTLVNQGVEPNLVILPLEDRFAGALFRKPLWEIDARGEFGQISYGQWEGLHIVRYPYIDPKSIVVADSRCLFGLTGPSASPIEVSVRELSRGEIEELQKKRESRIDDQPGRRVEAQVLVRVFTAPILGIIVDDKDRAEGSISLSIQDSNAGYAMFPGDSLYHRPSCPLVEGHDEVQYALIRHLPEETTDRAPCPTCHPERWNHEGRRGGGTTSGPAA